MKEAPEGKCYMQHSFYSDSIDLNIELDASSRLPLVSEKDRIRELILNYLPLPYSIAEYGCGKKSSLIIKKLIDLGIPSYAIQRGMIMEKDMSDAALAEDDFQRRPHALVVYNSLYHIFDPDNAVILNRLQKQGIEIRRSDGDDELILVAGEYALSHAKTLQFVQARSHIFVIVYFFDHRYNRVRPYVIDPTIEREDLFGVSQMRKYLHAPEGLIYLAPLLGEFRLDESCMTENQRRYLYHRMLDRPLESLSREEHFDLIRELNGASAGSIGDPATWTYANNMQVNDAAQQERQVKLTGTGNAFRESLASLAIARRRGQEEKVVELVSQMRDLATKLGLLENVRVDGYWSERQLEPLKKVVNLVADQVAVDELMERIRKNIPIQQALTTKRGLTSLFGMGFRLRERIEELARVSRNGRGQISAQALTDEYFSAARNLIQQMNQAGLSVCIDTVGNIHGLLISADTAASIMKNARLLSEVTDQSLSMGSHIDTVADAGKYDGRLGVLSGIEVAEILRDLHEDYGIAMIYPAVPRTMIVTAFVGEEMSFTGQGVSMPGSAAVAGLADPERIYRMTNRSGQTYEDCLQRMLVFLKGCESRGEIRTLNRLGDREDGDLLQSCFSPQSFYSKHSYERHIEQGSRLHESAVPMVLVHTIMGIYQEDFTFEGEHAEQAALECIAHIREMALTPSNDAEMRLTVGVLSPEKKEQIELDYGMRWHLTGMKGHAGGASVYERADAGVAISRLHHFFQNLKTDFQSRLSRSVDWISGASSLVPGTNRNVIPGEASITLGLRGDVPPEDRQYLLKQLQGFVVSNLSLDVKKGGEGLLAHDVQEVSLLNRARRLRFSLDIRYADTERRTTVLDSLQEFLNNCCQRWNVTLSRSIEQQLRPYKLTESGQALQMERSYGGSHNPLETELARDVLRGTLLQLAVTHDFLKLDRSVPVNLYSFVHDRMPSSWKDTIPAFVSGALHDTCNIAAAGQDH